jgi:hypothetical protein
MESDHMVVMLRDPDLAKVLPEKILELPAGHEIVLDLPAPAGHIIELEVAPV